MQRAHGQEGVALLITILVVALMTIIVVEFTYSTEVEAHLARHALSATQASYLARAGVALAEITLRLDAENKATSKPPIAYDALTDLWAQPFPPQEIGQNVGGAGFVISDESARFNVNGLALRATPGNVTLEARKTVFQSILAAIGLDTNLIFPLLDWLDDDDEVTSQNGAEKEYYAGLTPPYLPRNGKLLDLDELGLVKGFNQLTPEQWRALRSVLTVRSDDRLQVNVNTAPAPLLVAIFSSVEAGGLAKTILENRVKQPFDQPAFDQLVNSTQMPPQIRTVLTTHSTVFTIHGVGVAADIARGIAVTEERTGEKLKILDWRSEVARPITLTSTRAFDGIPVSPP